jgi:hypothetical protein
MRLFFFRFPSGFGTALFEAASTFSTASRKRVANTRSDAPLILNVMLKALLFLPIAFSANLAFAQFDSPAASTSVTIAGKNIKIDYHAPQMHNRKIFGGLEPYNKVWRAGANEATALHTDADLQIKTLAVPKGNYTIFVWLDPKQWQLIINKQTGQWGLEYDQSRDLGRIPMDMKKPPSPIDVFKITLTSLGNDAPKVGKLQLEWETTIASVPIAVK